MAKNSKKSQSVQPEGRIEIAQTFEELGAVVNVKAPAFDFSFLNGDPILAQKDYAITLVDEVNALDEQYDRIHANVVCTQQEYAYNYGKQEKIVKEFQREHDRLQSRLDGYRRDYISALKETQQYKSAMVWYAKNPKGKQDFDNQVNIQAELWMVKQGEKDIEALANITVELTEAEKVLAEIKTSYEAIVDVSKREGAAVWAERTAKINEAQKVLDDAGFELSAEEMTIRAQMEKSKAIEMKKKEEKRNGKTQSK